MGGGVGSTGVGSTGVGHSTHGTGVSATPGSGNTNKTAGPHNSDVLNKLDPRVDSDIAKPEKALQLESMVLNMAKNGKIKEPISENQFKMMAESTVDNKAKLDLPRRG